MVRFALKLAPPVWFELSGQMPVAIAKTAHRAVS